MTTTELVNAVKRKGKTSEVCALRMVLIYVLYQAGYKTQHIADAIRLCRSNVMYSRKKAQDLLDVNDPIAKRSLDQLQEHSIRLIPHFEKNGLGYKIKTFIEIDNVEL